MDSRPGPAGIPYSAWKASGEIGVGCLYAIYRELVDHQPLPPNFNDSAAAFLPCLLYTSPSPRDRSRS
eukprot:2499914-Pyramimonas_sp.AAC.1